MWLCVVCSSVLVPQESFVFACNFQNDYIASQVDSTEGEACLHSVCTSASWPCWGVGHGDENSTTVVWGGKTVLVAAPLRGQGSLLAGLKLPAVPHSETTGCWLPSCHRPTFLISHLETCPESTSRRLVYVSIER